MSGGAGLLTLLGSIILLGPLNPFDTAVLGLVAFSIVPGQTIVRLLLAAPKHAVYFD
jgi:hypothetical protein